MYTVIIDGVRTYFDSWDRAVAAGSTGEFLGDLVAY